MLKIFRYEPIISNRPLSQTKFFIRLLFCWNAFVSDWFLLCVSVFLLSIHDRWKKKKTHERKRTYINKKWALFLVDYFLAWLTIFICTCFSFIFIWTINGFEHTNPVRWRLFWCENVWFERSIFVFEIMANNWSAEMKIFLHTIRSIGWTMCLDSDFSSW